MSGTSNTYRFGAFVIDTAKREVRKGRDVHSLPAKAFECIAYLVEHRDRAVGRDELISAIWGRADVSDSVLSQTVLNARRALEDTGREQQAIRTVIGFGYHWVAPVERVEAGEPVEAVMGDVVGRPRATTREAGAPAPPSRRWRVLPGITALLLLAAVAWFALHRAPAPSGAGDAVGGLHTALLVLPVEGADAAEDVWMRLGVMDLLAERLHATGQPVVPSDQVVGLARAFDVDRAGELEKLADAARADIIVRSRVERHGALWHAELRTVHGHEPALVARGESADVLDAALVAADDIARQLGLPVPAGAAAGMGQPPLRVLLQQVRAATLGDRLDEARRLIEQADPAYRDDPEVGYRLARIEAQAGQRARAKSQLRALLGRVSAEADPLMRARVLNALGAITTEDGEPALGEPWHDEAIRLLQGSGHDGQLGKAYGDRALARFAQRKDTEALQDFAAARAALEAAGDRLSLDFLDYNLGAFDMLRGHYREAVQAFERAAVRFESLRIHYAALTAWDGVAQSKLILLEPAAALQVEPRLRELAARVADPRSRIDAGLTRVEILAANGMSGAAAGLLRELRQELAGMEGGRLAARAAALAARPLLAAGDAARAVQEAQRAFAGFARADDSRQRSRNWLVLVRARLMARQLDEAAADVARINAIAMRESDPSVRLYAAIAQAEVDAASGRHPQAEAGFRQALADAELGRVPRDVLEAAGAHATWLLGQRDFAEAAAVVERVAPWVERSYEASLLQLRYYRAAGPAPAWRMASARTLGLAGERVPPAGLVSPP